MWCIIIRLFKTLQKSYIFPKTILSFGLHEHELGEKKVEYEGTLNDLYEQDIQKFIDYNVQDVRLIKRLDDKLDYIDIPVVYVILVIVLTKKYIGHHDILRDDISIL